MTLTVVKLSLGKDCHYSGFSIKLFIKRLVVRLSFGKDCDITRGFSIKPNRCAG
ncbi:hypothetical protein [Methanosarcina barkeri]|uniref:hypothetical protein n=1 Tax=Methanosarcina barkeri TaxID=2208 RepID=UPI0012D38434|nr:hypothetical protein [Methanosarcina barkeri]